MNQDSGPDARLRQYLLDETGEPERSRIEAEYFADDRLFEHLLVVEEELMDAFAAGELAPAEREQFQRAYLANPPRRERVAFAQSLQAASARGRMNEVPVTTAGFSAWLNAFAARHLVPAVPQWAAGAAAILLVAGVSWLALERARLQQAIVGLQDDSVRIARQTQDVQARLDEERRRAEALAEQLRRGASSTQEPRQGATSTTPGRAIATFLLGPRLVRGAGQANTITILPGTALVRLTLEIADDSHRRYSPKLFTASGNDVWTQHAVAARSTQAGPVVILDLPASLLTGSDYVLMLSGLAGSELEEVASYSFRVERK